METMSYAKPMAVDVLFWHIVGLPENDKLPLSFRASGAWVLRPPNVKAYIALDECDPERLASEFVTWSTARMPEVDAYSVEGLLSNIEELGPRRKYFAALEICLLLQLDDWKGAFARCHDRGRHESGGFGVCNKTFFDLARDWIVA